MLLLFHSYFTILFLMEKVKKQNKPVICIGANQFGTDVFCLHNDP